MKKSEPIEVEMDEINRDLVLFGEIDKPLVSDIVKDILEINRYDSIEEKNNSKYIRQSINLHVCSEGGDVMAGLALIGVISSSKTPVYIYCYGSIMSIALSIIVSGDYVKAHRMCRFMYHEMSLVGEIDSTLTSMTSDLRENTITDQLCDDYLVERTKISRRRMNQSKKTKTDWYFGAEEAFKYGVINEIF